MIETAVKNATGATSATTLIKLVGASNMVVNGSSDSAATIISNTEAALPGNMNKAYECLQHGDCLVKSGHAMLVISVSSSSDYVTVVDQYGWGASTNSTWRRDKTVYFSTLRAEGYLPIAAYD